LKPPTLGTSERMLTVPAPPTFTISVSPVVTGMVAVTRPPRPPLR